MQLAYLSLEQAAKDVGCCVDVGYGTDLRLQPLRNRNEVWDIEKESNDWTQLFTVNEADSYTKEELTKVFEKELEKPNMSFIFAAWDFIAISAVDAIRNTNSPAKLYGIDITTEDIHYMTDPGSPWVATACTVPRMDGAATLRVAALKLAGQLNMEPASEVLIPVSLVLQSFLRENNVQNTTDLLVQMPELQLLDFMSACWIPPIDIYQVTFS